MRWTVMLDMRLLRTIAVWPERNRHELLAIKRLLESGGPSGIDWDAAALAGVASWELIDEPFRRGYWTAFGERFYWLSLEVLPGRAIRVHDARCGVRRRRTH